jgi:hypothetical protein
MSDQCQNLTSEDNHTGVRRYNIYNNPEYARERNKKATQIKKAANGKKARGGKRIQL